MLNPRVSRPSYAVFVAVLLGVTWRASPARAQAAEGPEATEPAQLPEGPGAAKPGGAPRSGGVGGPGPGLVLTPWVGDARAETLDDLTFESKGRTDDGDAFKLWWWDSTGRIRLDTSDPWSPSLGYRALMIDLDTRNPRLPARLTDTALAAGFQLGQWGDWHVGGVFGAGYAGDNPFADPSAVYGLAYLTFTKPVGEHDAWLLSLNYNGNRTLFPDIPLPGIAYRHDDPAFGYTVGLPYSSVRWKPLDRLTLEASYVPVLTVEAQATYQLSDELSVFGRYSHFFEGFQLNDDRDHERLFFEMRRAEAGVRWVHGKWIDLTVSGGYAFDQEFSHGFDARDLENHFSVSDEPYVRFMLQGTF